MHRTFGEEERSLRDAKPQLISGTRARARIAALIAVALACALPAGAAASAASPLNASVKTRSGGAQGVVIRVSVRAPRRSFCSATVRAPRSKSLALPRLRVTARTTSWDWLAPSSAPAGRWKATVSCLSASSLKKRIVAFKPRVRGGSSGLSFPGSLSVRGGARLVKPPSQMPGTSRGAGNPGEGGYCTWGAWNKAQWLGGYVQGDAKHWYSSGTRNGLPGGRTPVVGAVFVSTRGQYGHVGIVTAIVNATTFKTIEMNGGSTWTNKGQGKTNEFGRYVEHVRYTGPEMFFLYRPGTQPGAYNGQIVQWAGDTKTQKTAWMIGADGKRRWIPTSKIYWCLKERGVPGPTALPAEVLDQYPDLTGQWVSCSAGGVGAGDGPAPAEDPATVQPQPQPSPPPPSPPPPAATWKETTGGPTNTWTNYTNAGGTQGPTIPAYTTVDIACKLTGFRVADGNTWWYRIASPPWNNTFYASADAFYNNGRTSGSLIGTPFVDPAVANC